MLELGAEFSIFLHHLELAMRWSTIGARRIQPNYHVIRYCATRSRSNPSLLCSINGPTDSKLLQKNSDLFEVT
jgi:hypothetical protein